jgi:hypothetical protein
MRYYTTPVVSLSPKRHAVVVRFLKVVGFSLFGWCLAAAAAGVTYVMSSASFDPAVVAIGASIAGGVAGAAQKSIAWKDYGVEPPPSSIGSPTDAN